MTRTRLKHLIRLAALIALQVVLSRFLAINIGTVLKFSFGFVAVVMAAHLYGVPGACAVAAVSDVIGAVLFPMGEFFIGYTLTATLTGLIYGLFLYKKRGKGVSDARILLAFVLNALLVTALLNTLMIAYQYGYRLAQVKDTANIAKRFWVYLPKRALEAVIMLPIQCIISAQLLKPRRSDALRQALLVPGALLMTLCLNVNISALRPLNEVEAFVKYIQAQLFTDPLVCAALFCLSVLLLLRARRAQGGLTVNLSGLILALIFTAGSYFFKSSAPIPSDTARQLVLFCSFLGAFVLFRALSALGFELFENLEDEAAPFRRKRCALILFLCCVPWLLIAFPGTLNADAYDQLNQFMGTLYPGQLFSRSAAVSTFSGSGTLINDAQSVPHTLLLGAVYWLFWKIGNGGLGIWFFVLMQTLLFSLTAARSLELLARAGLKGKALKLLTAFYGLFPLYPMYFCATLKESALSIALLSACTFIAEMILFPAETLARKRRLLGGAAAILACLLLRSFTAVLLLPLTVYALVRARREGLIRRFFATCLSAYALWAILTFGVYPLAGIGKGPGVETRSLMLQQTALYTIEQGDTLEEEDWQRIEETYGTRALAENYLPDDADPLKFYTPDRSDPTRYAGNALHVRDWEGFHALWRKLGRKSPDTYLRAYLAMEAGYWDLRGDAPSSGLQLYLGDYGRYENGFEGENLRATPGLVEVSVSRFSLRLQKLVSSLVLGLSRLPVLSLLFRSGSYLSLCLLAFLYALKTRRRVWILPLMLVLYGIGLGFGPVSGHSRYAFPILVCAPFAIFLCAARAAKTTATEMKR
ncbi:MAG: folate family ECF transporter S component [Clostridia bacterium]|nr:folate family ECF transporter S component [Clostridia bacterium]